MKERVVVRAVRVWKTRLDCEIVDMLALFF